MSGANESAVERAHARVGATLRGKWRLDALLGVGGMAAVYAATHRNGARAAIKMLHLAVSLDAGSRQRFLREGYVANAVGHPGAVRVLDDDVAEDGSAFLVMELLDGESLDTMAERRGGRLPAAEVLPLAARLCDVLVAAHQRGIVHRDIKPDNVFLTRDGVLKLLDFGIARMRDGGAVALTAEGTSFGTPAFMAPEQALGRSDQIDGRTDLFSVGATLFSLLTGRYVHVTRTLNEQLVAQATQPPPPLGAVAPDLPRAVAAVVDRALAFDKERRWPDARTMREAIQRALDELARPVAAAAPIAGAAPFPIAGAAPFPIAGAAPFPAPPYAPPAIGAAPAPAPAAQAGTIAGTVSPTGKPSRGPSMVVVGFVVGMSCVAGAAAVLLSAGRKAPGAPAPATHEEAPASAAPSAAPPSPVSAAPPASAPPAASSSPSAATEPPPAVHPVTMGTTPPNPALVKPAVVDKAGAKKPPSVKKGPDDTWLDKQH